MHATPVNPGDVRYPRLLTWALWSGIFLSGGYHVGLHLATLGLQEPMGSWETVYAAIARTWPHQYQWSHYVEGHDGYGPAYPSFVRPFLSLNLDVYLAHRIASLVAIALACGLLARMLRRQGCSLLSIAALIAIFYALNAGSYSIQARPDFLVLLETTALLALGEAVIRGQLKLGPSFGVGYGLLALAAFFTKAYGVVVWGSVLGYVLLFVDRKGGLYAAVVGGVVLGAGIWLFAAENPLYFMEVFQGPVVQAAPSFAWLRYQTSHFILLAGGVIAVALLPFATKLIGRKRPTDEKPPPPSNAVTRYWQWQAIVAVLVLIVGPAWHTGAYLTYFLHLLLVPLVMLAGVALRQNPATTKYLDLALLANLAVLLVVAPGWPRPDAGWAELRRDILKESGRIAVDYIMEPLAREKGSVKVISTGATGYILKEPFLISNASSTVQQARTAATRFMQAELDELFGGTPMDVIYLDCLVTNSASGRGYSIIPRNELPYFRDARMNDYLPDKMYPIRPFYFATNAPRQEAGTIETVVVKFVRKH